MSVSYTRLHEEVTENKEEKTSVAVGEWEPKSPEYKSGTVTYKPLGPGWKVRLQITQSMIDLSPHQLTLSLLYFILELTIYSEKGHGQHI